MRTVDDWLEDWLAEHRNVRLEEAHSMANAGLSQIFLVNSLLTTTGEIPLLV